MISQLSLETISEIEKNRTGNSAVDSTNEIRQFFRIVVTSEHQMTRGAGIESRDNIAEFHFTILSALERLPEGRISFVFTGVGAVKVSN